MPSQSAPAPRLIQRKITIPKRDPRALLRWRVIDKFRTLIEQYGVVFVRAAAGSGKTTAVVDSATSSSRHVAWLTVDGTDAAPGRLLTYLEASLAKACGDAMGIVEQATGNRIPHAETAGILAESVAETGTVLVVDDAERLADAPDALEVLAAFARYVPDDCRLVIISQIDLPLDVNGSHALTATSVVEDDFLAFTVDEAREALTNIGYDGIDVAEAVAATGGWATAVIFEAWRSSESTLVTRQDSQRLHDYLSAHIFDRLPGEERRFLVRTAVLDAVSIDRAQALGVSEAGALLAGLRVKHIPATWSDDDGTMRVHTVFRTYLLQLLEREGSEDVRSLRRSYGQLLVSEGHFEEAVEQFVNAGDIDAAVSAMETALPSVVRRMDFAIAERWLQLLESYGAGEHPENIVATLMIAVGREQYWRVVQMADDMTHRVREAVFSRSPAGAAIAAWCYWHLGRISDARAVFARAGPSRATDIARGMFGLSDDGPIHLAAIDTVSPGSLDPLLPRIAYYCGRFALLEQAVLTSPWASMMASAWRVGALRATGRTEEALDLYERTVHEGTSVWLQAIAYPETLGDLGRDDEAWEALLRGRDLSHRGGSVVHRALSLLLEAKFHLRLSRDTTGARRVLDSMADVLVADYAFLREARLTLLGFADLLDGRIEEAVRQLTDAAATMRSSGRLLHLPVAEVYLAEALWRHGEEDASDRATQRALDAAAGQGSNFLLLQALSDVPEVSTRCIDAEEDPAGPWHALGRDLVSRSAAPEVSGTVRAYLNDLGVLRLTVGDVFTKPRIRKSLELLAYLLGQPSGGARRDVVLDALFDGRDSRSSRSYLRQAVHRLREVLPAELGITSDDDTIRLVPAGSFDSDWRRLTRLLHEASSQQGEDRLRLFEKAIELADLGEYAADVTSEWAVVRRDELTSALNRARYEAAELAYRLGRYTEADDMVSALLEQDPYREQGWQLAMRLAGALGHTDRVVAAYRQCCAVLAEIRLRPSRQTERTFQQLR